MTTPRLAGAPAELVRLRDEIARVDRAMVTLVADRVQLARRAAAIKRLAGLPPIDTAHEAVVIRRAAALARARGLETEAVRDVFWRVIGLCRRAQQDG